MDSAWKAVYDSVEGTSHRLNGSPLQDCCRVLETGDEQEHLLIVACADGAGSAPHGDVGASTACDAFIEAVRRGRGFWHEAEGDLSDPVAELCEKLHSAVVSRSADLDVTPRELATTFLGAIVGPARAVFIQIGDGAIVVREDDEYRTVFWPQSGEFVNTTNFLTDEAYAGKVEWEARSERIDELALFTDGLERLILDFGECRVHQPFLMPFFETLRESHDVEPLFTQLRAFLDCSDVNERTDDDKTLILATRLDECSPEDAIG